MHLCQIICNRCRISVCIIFWASVFIFSNFLKYSNLYLLYLSAETCGLQKNLPVSYSKIRFTSKCPLEWFFVNLTKSSVKETTYFYQFHTVCRGVFHKSIFLRVQKVKEVWLVAWRLSNFS